MTDSQEPAALTVACWNTQWNGDRSLKGAKLRNLLSVCAPARLVPERLSELLQRTLNGLDVWTAGVLPGLQEQFLCHVAGTSTTGWSWSTHGLSRHVDGLEVSDHDVLVVRLTQGD